MDTLVSDLSDWYYVYETSKALINSNTYATMTISNGIAVWIFTKGGYLVLSLARAYPGTSAIFLAPLLVKSPTRQIIKWGLGQTASLAAKSTRLVKGWIYPQSQLRK